MSRLSLYCEWYIQWEDSKLWCFAVCFTSMKTCMSVIRAVCNVSRYGACLWASVDAEALGLRVRSPLAPILTHIYILLQLWFGTAHSIVVYIVPVFKNILFPFLYSFPPGMGYQQQYDTAHPDSRTTQGTRFPAGLGPVSLFAQSLWRAGGCSSPVSRSPPWRSPEGRPLQQLSPSALCHSWESPLPKKHRTTTRPPWLCGAGTDYVETAMYRWTSSLRCVNHLPYNVYQMV